MALLRPDDLIPTHHILQLMDQAARNLGSSTFGLLVGADNGIDTLGSFGRLIANALTVHHAFETSCRLLHLHSSAAHNWLTEAGDEVWFCRSQFRGPEIGHRELEQHVVLMMIDHVRMGAGPSWRPAKVCLQTREAPDRELREALGDPHIHTVQSITGIAVPRAVLSLPVRRHCAAPRGEAEAVEARLWHTLPAASFHGVLRQLIGTLLKEGCPPIETMAEITGLSVRSLQRRLARNAVTYSELVDQARFEAARRWLQDEGPTVTEIAMELGYSDAANFTRAFKRWAGVSPRQYRTQRLAA